MECAKSTFNFDEKSTHGIHHLLFNLIYKIMVKLKFVVIGGVLTLRISENKTRCYKRVNHLLKGNPNVEKHWNQEKERFSSYAVSYSDNNKILEEFKGIYWKLIQEHPELNARQISDYYKTKAQESLKKDVFENWSVDDYKNSVEKYLEIVILREKAKQGCNYELYYKLLLRCRMDIPGFSTMAFSTIDYNTMVSIALIFAKRKSYRHVSKTFRALLGKAHKDQNVMFNLAQIGTFCFNEYNPDRYDVSDKHPDVLTDEQIRRFLNLSVQDITPTYNNRQQVELYYDFCVFMFHTFFAPCDVIKAKLRDITRNNTLLVKRKKTHRTVEVPITPVVRSIINKYKGMSKDGYIFPIMNDEYEKNHTVKDYTYKKFREHLNIWLKLIGKELDTDFDLYAYVFRHTAITIAVNNGLPLSYISNAAGTSVEMIQKHYYNGENIHNRNMLAEVFMKAGA